MNDIETFKLILEKYQLTKPIPPEVREIIWKSKRRSLVAIFKRAKEYTSVIGIIFFIMYLPNNIGRSLSLRQSTIILYILSLISVIVILYLITFQHLFI